jgi:hypothetical protein
MTITLLGPKSYFFDYILFYLVFISKRWYGAKVVHFVWTFLSILSPIYHIPLWCVKSKICKKNASINLTMSV